MKNKTSGLLLAILLLVSFAAAQGVEFRDDEPVQFYTEAEMNSNPLTGLPDPSSQSEPVTLSYLQNDYSAEGSQTLEQVLEEGNVANQSIDMDSNSVVGLPDATVDSEPLTLGQAGEKYVSTGGDKIGGNLDMNGSNIILNGGYLSNDGDDEGVSVDDSGNVQISNGNLDMNGNDMTSSSEICAGDMC